MSYQDPYADPYNGGRTNTGPNYSQNPYSETNLNYNPYTQPSHPTYDQSGYGAGVHEEPAYTDEPTYPPQRRPTHKDHNSQSSVNFHQRNESYQPGADFASSLPREKTPNALRRYRYENQGALWTRGGRGRCIGRFCCCTIMTVVFLLVSIALALILWVRPPGLAIGDVAPVSQGGSQITTQEVGDGDVSLTIHLAVKITVNNPNYFSVNFKQIKAELFYPINNTPIGGGTSQNVVFPSNTQTDWTFPFDVQYNTTADPQSRILADLINKCGANRSNLNVGYKITLGLRILFITISPVISNTFSFPCPLDKSTLDQISGGKIGGALGS